MSEAGVIRSRKILVLQITRVGLLVCAGLLAFELSPINETKTTDLSLRKFQLSTSAEDAGFLTEARQERKAALRDGSEVSLEERENRWAGGRTPVKQRAEFSAKRLDGLDGGNEDSVDYLELKVLTAANPGTKIDTIEALTQVEDLDKAMQVLSQVVVIDRNADVRLAALEALDEIDEVPFEILADVATYDADPMLRLEALDLIGDGQERGRRVIDLLRRVAKIDSSGEVRQMAATLLETLFDGNRRA